jgi:hypothetical protein
MVIHAYGNELVAGSASVRMELLTWLLSVEGVGVAVPATTTSAFPEAPLAAPT